MNKYLKKYIKNHKYIASLAVTIILAILSIVLLFTDANIPLIPHNISLNSPSKPTPELTHSGNSNSKGSTTDKANVSLSTLCDEIFVHIVTSDRITLNYTLSSPEKYGITEIENSLGEYSITSMQSEQVYYENKLDLLKKIDYESLSSEDKTNYSTLYETLSSYIDIAPFFMYDEPLSPVSGIHVQLPVLLSEYHFYNEKAIQDYLMLIESIPSYFAQIMKFEAQKRNEGLFMGTATANMVITECEEFISDPDSNMLIQVFEDNIKSVNLPDSSRSEYIAKNEQLIREALIPAYRSIISGLQEITELEDAPSPAMCNLPDGREYYTRLVHTQTGSDMQPEEIKTTLSQAINNCRETITTNILDHPDVYEKINSLTYAADTPEDIITHLSNNICKEYPALETDTNSLNIKYVHPSLENTLSPAMYITPPIDCNVTDDIYINRSCIDNTSMFPTLAHEGYPGHLYQYEYYMGTNPHPLRLVLSFGGYTEGWATYAELFSYDIAGIDTVSATILKNIKLATLCMYSMLDLGIHYYGWSYDECASYMSEFGIENKENINEIYRTIIAEPALYLKYTIGCLEFIQLENDVKAASGADYDPVSFHKAVLETGPTWFKILRKKLTICY